MEIPIPKDIREYEPKLIGPFTTRQCIGLGVAAVGGYAMYALATSVLGLSIESLAFTLMCFCGCAPGAAYGFVKPYGMPIEKYLKTAFAETFVSPRYRKYELPTLFPESEDEETITEFENSNKKGKKKKEKEVKSKPVKAKNIPPELIAYK